MWRKYIEHWLYNYISPYDVTPQQQFSMKFSLYLSCFRKTQALWDRSVTDLNWMCQPIPVSGMREKVKTWTSILTVRHYRSLFFSLLIFFYQKTTCPPESCTVKIPTTPKKKVDQRSQIISCCTNLGAIFNSSSTIQVSYDLRRGDETWTEAGRLVASGSHAEKGEGQWA